MKKSAAVTLGVVAAAAVSFACASEPDQEFMDVQADYTEVCAEVVSENEFIRRDDDRCAHDTDGGSHTVHTSGLYWYYLGRATQAPPVGSRNCCASRPWANLS